MNAGRYFVLRVKQKWNNEDVSMLKLLSLDNDMDDFFGQLVDSFWTLGKKVLKFLCYLQCNSYRHSMILSFIFIPKLHHHFLKIR